MRPTTCFALLALLLCSPAPALAQITADVHTSLRPVVVAPDEGERRYLPDGRHILLKVGPESTGSSYLFLGAEDLPPGSSIPRHRHEVDEEILIVHRGEVMVELDGVSRAASAGSVVYLPPRSWISLRNDGPEVATIMFVFPRASVERCFQFVGRGEEGEPSDDEAARLEERRACQMTYRPAQE